MVRRRWSVGRAGRAGRKGVEDWSSAAGPRGRVICRTNRKRRPCVLREHRWCSRELLGRGLSWGDSRRSDVPLRSRFSFRPPTLGSKADGGQQTLPSTSAKRRKRLQGITAAHVLLRLGGLLPRERSRIFSEHPSEFKISIREWASEGKGRARFPTGPQAHRRCGIRFLGLSLSIALFAWMTALSRSG